MDTKTSIMYDPSRQGWDTGLWKVLSGTVTLATFMTPDIDLSDIGADAPYESFGVAEAVTVSIT